MERDDEGKPANADPPQREGGGKRTAVSVKDDLLGDIEFDLIDEEVDSEDTINDVFARDTAIPAPPDHLGAETVRPFEEGEEPASQPKFRNHPRVPPPPPMRQASTSATIEPPSEDLEFDSFDPPVDVFGHPIPGMRPVAPQRPGFGHSEMPTAPPLAARDLLEQAKRSMPAPEQRPHRHPFANPTPEPRPRHPFASPTPEPRAPRHPWGETARNAPTQDIIDRATRPDRSNANGRAYTGRESDPLQDSALDFIDGHDPLDSLAPMPGLDAPDPPANAPRAGPREMQECYAVGDFSRALSIAEDILSRTPDDMPARRCAQNCRDVLTQMFAARIGPLDQVVRVVVSPEEVQWLALDHRAGFLLSLVDGQSTVDEILDISGMTRLDALKIIFDLTERQVVRLA
jgi:hypothetical protein